MLKTVNASNNTLDGLSNVHSTSEKSDNKLTNIQYVLSISLKADLTFNFN